MHGADDAERDADRGGEQQRQPGQPRGDRDPRQDLVQRRLLGDVGIAEVAMQQAADPVEILDDDRLAQAELALQVGLVGGIDEAGGVEQDVDNVAGNDPQQHEDDDRDPEQGHEHQEQPPDDIGKHPGSLPDPVRALLLTRFRYANRYPLRSKTLWLLVEPDVFVAIAVIGAVGHHRDILDVRLPAGAGSGMEDDRTRDVLLQPLVDLPDQFLALVDIGL